MSLRTWLHEVVTPAGAFVSFFAAFYGTLVASSREDWVAIVLVAAATLVSVVLAFVLRRRRPNLALLLAIVPASLLAAVFLIG